MEGISLEEAIRLLQRRAENTDDVLESLACAQAAHKVREVKDRLDASRRFGAADLV